ncbi:hypothetical protein [Nocardioides alkalitolerans]|uniref:hypothetical protein n=1 Tax=Nocardioides alkalitolerans TaxID=281714 RepID=UPI0003F7903B|nr:hypothetical protein [Nocardioides alkalitolerans]
MTTPDRDTQKTAERVEGLGAMLLIVGAIALGGALDGVLLAVAFGALAAGALLVLVANA